MIYLIDGRGHHIGPFKNQDSVQRFIRMMALCGEEWVDSEVLEGNAEVSPRHDPVQLGPGANPRKSSFTQKSDGRES